MKEMIFLWSLILGGIIATIAFMAFLFFTGVFESATALLTTGATFIIAAVIIQKKLDTILVDTFCVSSYLLGFVLLGLGMSEKSLDFNLILSMMLLISLVAMFLMKNHILSFVSVLLINGFIYALLSNNNLYDWIHLQVAVLAFLLTLLFLKEAKILTMRNFISRIYNPLRAGIIVSFIAGLFMVSKSGIFRVSRDHVGISSTIIIISAVYLLSKVCKLLLITRKSHKILVYVIAYIVLLPTILYPMISGAILVILLSFLHNYKTGLVIGIATFIYSISQYYYDLNFSLLTKSILLFVSGALFLLLYLFTHKKLNSDEKI
ncbi:MAG: DUF4401 domain-containing protein [Crocinitomicaceae bacterium]|nr:DUF4401 domain-containing protein [Crocinitomicaceae bacterium]